MKRRIPVLVLLAAAASVARAQPVGSEFQVSQEFVGDQVGGRAGFSGLGTFVIAWRDGGSNNVYARRYSASGLPLTGDFRVNSATQPAQQVDVASTPTGAFVVVWWDIEASSNAIYAQRYASTGSPLGGPVTVVSTGNTTVQTFYPNVASDANGNFVVVWVSIDQSNLATSIDGRRFSSAGAALGGTFHASVGTTLDATHPSVSSDPHGNFVVVWHSAGDGDGYAVLARRFLSNGSAVGSPFQVNSSTPGDQQNASVSMAGDGSFVVVWDTSFHGVFGQRFDPSGIAAGAEFRVNEFTSGLNEDSFVVNAGSGGFMVAWEGPDENGYGTFARFYDRSGHAITSAFQLNTYTTNNQYPSGVATDGAGRFLVLWNDAMQDGSGSGVYAERLVQPPLPLTDEFRVNTATTNFQAYPRVAENAAGGFMVVWTTATTFDIEAQRYSGPGVPVGGEFRVNTQLGGNHAAPSVAFAPSAQSFVVWDDSTHDGSTFGIFGRRYAADGTPLTSDFRINTHTTSSQVAPSVAYDGAGKSIVVWSSNAQDGDLFGVFGQRFDASGSQAGGEFAINTYTTGSQVAGGVAADAAGDFVVVWTGPGPTGTGIQARRFSSSGAPLGAELLVNGITGGVQILPTVTMDSAGGFVVAWEGTGFDGSSYGIAARRFSSSGTPIGVQFTVNSYTSGDQLEPVVSGDGTGAFAVVWHSPRSFFGLDVFGQLYEKSGEPVGTEFQVNTYQAYDQAFPAVALGKSVVVAWQSLNQDQSQTGIYARVFAPPCQPGDSNGDGTVDVADVFYLVNSLFASGAPPICSGNVNGDATTDVSDVFYLINYLFAGGPPPL